jgi:hypothetical protein
MKDGKERNTIEAAMARKHISKLLASDVQSGV